MSNNQNDNPNESDTIQFQTTHPQNNDNQEDYQNDESFSYDEATSNYDDDYDDYSDYEEEYQNDEYEENLTDDEEKTRSDNITEFDNKMYALKYLLGDINFMDITVRLFASYFITMLHKTARISEKFLNLEFGTNIDMLNFVVEIIFVFILLSFVRHFVNKIPNTAIKTDGYFLGTSVMLYGVYTVYRLDNFYYALGVSLVVSTIMVFLIHNDYFKEFATLSKWQGRTIVFILFLCFAVCMGFMCVYRYLSYTTSCFDFGIFCQMFYYMVHHGLSPETTCERNYLLSHFAVHVSPIYYLLLPIFAIFQSPKTLLISQAIIVSSAVIPLYMICKKFKFSNASTVGLCAMLIFSPALIASTFFDFHENKFLVPLVMWLFWAIETNHIKLMYVFCVLVLLVKEDAFIYVASISLFVMFSKKMYYNKKQDKEKSMILHGFIMLILSLVYFFVVSKLMEKYGLGVMEYRYSNVMMDRDAGLTNVIKTIALNPALAIYEAFTEDKIKFFLQMVSPLLFLPFINKKISHLFLLIPFFLVNLISDYTYQTQIGYQYVCGVMSMLIYLSVLNLHDLKSIPKRYIASACMCTSMIMGFMYFTDKFLYIDSYCNNYGRIMRMNNLVSQIPQDASVESTTYFIPQLSQRDEIYMLENKEPSHEPTDFILIRVGSGEEDFTEDKLNWIMDNGYEFYNGYTDLMYVFVQSDYIEAHPELKENQRLQPIVWEK